MAPAEFPTLSVIALQPSTVASFVDLPLKKKALLIRSTWTNIIKTYNKDRASKSKLYDLFANAVDWKTL